MRAITHPEPGSTVIGPHVDPSISDRQLLIRVRASGLNRADLLQRDGKYAAPPGWPADIPGLEYAGEVVATGSGVTRWRPGDRLMGIVGGGAHAELIAVDEDEPLAIPAGMPFTDAAAIPEAFLTAWDAMVVQGCAVAGERVLFHAIGSGVGTAAAQVGPALGLIVIGTSRSAGKLERARELGMSHGVLTTDADWPATVGGPVDVIIDTLGATAFEQNLALLAPRGRLVVLGTMTGGRAPGVDLSRILRNRLQITGTAMRVRSHEERVALVALFTAEILPLFAAGKLRPIVDRVLPAAGIDAAFAAMKDSGNFGKIVLEW